MLRSVLDRDMQRGSGSAAKSTGGSPRPSFSGERIDFTAWFMLFSAYVAYKLVSAASLVAGTRPKPPAAPSPNMGRAAPEPPAPPAPVLTADGSTVNEAEIDATNAARLA
jgi:hypothetical protein